MSKPRNGTFSKARKYQPLGELFNVVGGGTPDRKNPDYYDGDIPWATIRDMQSDALSATERSITSFGLKNSSATLIPKGEVIMASRVGLGKACILEQETAINQDIRALLPKRQEQVNRKFCLYWLQSVASVIVAAGSGATVQGVRLPFIKSLPFPVIGLREQEKVVAKLDQAFAAIDCIRGNIEANFASARQLFGAAVEEVGKRRADFQRKKLRLGSIATRLTNGYVGPTRGIYVDAGVPYLLARHVRSNTLAFDGRTYISSAFNEQLKKSKLKSGDVLLVQSGHIGHSAVVPPAHDGHNCHAMIVISPIDEIVSGAYLSMLFSTPRMQETFQRIRSGSTVPHLNCKAVKELMLDIPPRKAQDEIIAEASKIGASVEIARKQYEANISDLTALRQSLFQQAFPV